MGYDIFADDFNAESTFGCDDSDQWVDGSWSSLSEQTKLKVPLTSFSNPDPANRRHNPSVPPGPQKEIFDDTNVFGDFDYGRVDPSFSSSIPQSLKSDFTPWSSPRSVMTLGTSFGTSFGTPTSTESTFCRSRRTRVELGKILKQIHLPHSG